MEFKRRIDLRQSFGHCEDRRDAYAAVEQDASARVARKREQVARLADGEGVALLYSIMHESRPTTGVWIAEYRDEIAVRLTGHVAQRILRSAEHTSELQSLMRISYAVFCLKKKKNNIIKNHIDTQKIELKHEKNKDKQ